MKTLQIPERFTGTVFVTMYSDPNNCLYGILTVSDVDVSNYDDRIVVGQVEVDIPLDSKGTLDKQVDQLRRAKQEIIDTATDKAKQIDEAIESLLAIEHQEDVA